VLNRNTDGFGLFREIFVTTPAPIGFRAKQGHRGFPNQIGLFRQAASLHNSGGALLALTPSTVPNGRRSNFYPLNEGLLTRCRPISISSPDCRAPDRPC